MRIISGSHRGRQLFPDKHFKARPTTDFAKENLFNVLQNLVELEGARVLDLFSGTGSISYEFASRGAGQIIAIESYYPHFSFIKHTAAALGFNNIKVYKTDAFLACARLVKSPFDIVFADPPYDLPRLPDLPATIFNNHLLLPGGIAVIEHPGNIDFSGTPGFLSLREYGSVHFSIFQENTGGK
ncbi:MAG: RsmD family RNA methyltransferase [Odoribacteraceae bacterium]|nr:RsmD family RNA methyltransferase [Odoribacteraceae bacterium]